MPFAALATFILLLAGFQTTAPANASGLVICTSDGATHGPLQPLDHKDCAHCIGQNGCSFSAFGKLLASNELGFAVHRQTAVVEPVIVSVALVLSALGGPPGIRAPPISA